MQRNTCQKSSSAKQFTAYKTDLEDFNGFCFQTSWNIWIPLELVPKSQARPWIFDSSDCAWSWSPHTSMYPNGEGSIEWLKLFALFLQSCPEISQYLLVFEVVFCNHTLTPLDPCLKKEPRGQRPKNSGKQIFKLSLDETTVLHCTLHIKVRQKSIFVQALGVQGLETKQVWTHIVLLRRPRQCHPKLQPVSLANRGGCVADASKHSIPIAMPSLHWTQPWR